jgi:catechol 2,3-dioxygenase-like lactoylglutathione lyase family enzyme
VKLLTFFVASILGVVICAASTAPKRPHVYGIVYVRFATSDMAKARDFYSLVLHSIPAASDSEKPCDWCERIPAGVNTDMARIGSILLEPLTDLNSKNLLKEIAFRTDDVKSLRNFLEKNHLAVEKLKKCGRDECFSVLDPEQHKLTFVQTTNAPSMGITGAYSSGTANTPIIHAGFVVKDRAATDHFYKDILGFRPYWHGGMKDDKDDWVAMEAPDEATWVEYMLNISPDASKDTLGVMNHIAIGVTDIHATEAKLIENGWKPTEQPKIGRDGKWQLNLYDPDHTRVEFMEFTPTRKPCCSEFTGPHPGPPASPSAPAKP